MESLEAFKIRAHSLRFDFPQNQLDLIKAPGIRKKSAREPYAVAAPKGDRDLTPPPPRGERLSRSPLLTTQLVASSPVPLQDHDPVPSGLFLFNFPFLRAIALRGSGAPRL